MRALQYFVREAVTMLWRRRRATAASVASIAAALAVVAAFLVVTSNLDRVLADWSETAELSVYLRDDITAEQEASLDRALLESGIVSSRTRVSKADAIARFRRDFPDLASAADVADENPFPASIDVRLQPDRAGSGVTDRLAGTIERMPGVADVRYDREWIDRLSRLAAFLRWSGWAVAALLVLATAATVAHVVRLGLYLRRDEIHIMELVGAPFAFVRGPFVVEGLLQGGIGALLALAMTWAAWAGLRLRLVAALSDLVDPGALAFLSPGLAALIVLGGMLVGATGGLIGGRHTP